jgi:hypothetical protein
MSEGRQLSLAEYIEEREAEKRAERAKGKRRAFVVIATDPEKAGQSDYRLTFACEAATKTEAEHKIRPLVGRRRLAAYLASGKYGRELPEARWVA